MEILYKVHNNLYVNLTNKCPCACTFCIRQNGDTVGESGSLWLEHEPDFEEVKKAFDLFNIDEYDELVFCGYGEPTEAFDVLKETARYVKNTWNKRIRLNTNGMGNLINERNIAPELRGLVDIVSISLNTPNPVRYQEIVRCKFGEKSFDAMIDFAKEVKKYVPEVVMSTVATTITGEEEEQCRKICDEIGATYRIREYES